VSAADPAKARNIDKKTPQKKKKKTPQTKPQINITNKHYINIIFVAPDSQTNATPPSLALPQVLTPHLGDSRGRARHIRYNRGLSKLPKYQWAVATAAGAGKFPVFLAFTHSLLPRQAAEIA
jgi:hypothetical protein